MTRKHDQATDDSMKGGLASTIDDLKQLLLGILLWSPLSFMQVRLGVCCCVQDISCRLAVAQAVGGSCQSSPSAHMLVVEPCSKDNTSCLDQTTCWF